jgi:hypothetical protein
MAFLGGIFRKFLLMRSDSVLDSIIKKLVFFKYLNLFSYIFGNHRTANYFY